MSSWKPRRDFYDDSTLREETFQLNLGPQHPATHGVLRLLVTLDGEIITKCEPVIGYSHRGHEKMGENRTYAQWIPNSSRMDYLSGMLLNHGWCEAVEKLCGIEVPRRAKYIRCITSELNRLASHIMWFGNYLMELGAFTPNLYSWDDRERILDILDDLSGSRLTYSYNRFGGVRNDLTPGFARACKEFIARFRKRMPMYEALCTKNVILIHRLRNVGVISRELAVNCAATGPCIRASGVEYDIRRYEPYAAYDEFDFIIPTSDKGDCRGRYDVRVIEMEQSMRIIEQALEGLPVGRIKSKVPRHLSPPEGEVYFACESARGETGFHIVSDGSEYPYRLKVRSASLSNVYLTVPALKNQFVADAVAILGSIDIIVPEIDR